MTTQVWSTPTVVVNNQVVSIIPGSFEFTEGLGEQSVRSQSAGGGIVEMVISDNAETKISDVKFKMFATTYNIQIIKSWKKNLSSNVITATHPTQPITRTFQSATMINQYVVQAKPDGEIDLEFKTSPAV